MTEKEKMLAGELYDWGDSELMEIWTSGKNLMQRLVDSLNKINAFWSYAGVTPENVSDEVLIEKVFIYLDMKDIALLFELYPRNYIRKVWRENMAIQGDYLFSLNVMIAMYYFDIKHPEKYLKRVEREHLKQFQ